jgi:hypothetical protein
MLEVTSVAPYHTLTFETISPEMKPSHNSPRLTACTITGNQKELTNMSKYKHLIAGLLIGVTMSGVGVAFADQSIQVGITDSIKFVFNGQAKPLPADQKVIYYKGYNYMPARFIAENLGANVSWDQTTKTIKLNTDPSSSQYFNQVVLPNGTRISSDGKTGTYNGTEYNLHFFVNNHTEIISKETVQTQYGPGTLMLVRQSAPAAANDPTTQDFYDLEIDRNLYNDTTQTNVNYPFILEAKITTNAATVKKDILEVAKYWYISDKTKAPTTP